MNDKISQLEKKITKVKSSRDALLNKDNLPKDNPWRLAMSMGLELVTGIVVGGLIGYGVDSFFTTTPVFLIIFLILGFISGILNIRRMSKGL